MKSSGNSGQTEAETTTTGQAGTGTEAANGSASPEARAIAEAIGEIFGVDAADIEIEEGGEEAGRTPGNEAERAEDEPGESPNFIEHRDPGDETERGKETCGGTVRAV